MTHFIRYAERLSDAVKYTIATNSHSENLPINEAFSSIAVDLKKFTKNNCLYMVGNGGSAGICSHMTTDFLKNGGVTSRSFNDSSLLTCFSNDYSYEEVFQKAVETLIFLLNK